MDAGWPPGHNAGCNDCRDDLQPQCLPEHCIHAVHDGFLPQDRQKGIFEKAGPRRSDLVHGHFGHRHHMGHVTGSLLFRDVGGILVIL